MPPKLESVFAKLTILLFIVSSFLQISAAVAGSTDDHADFVLEETTSVSYTYAIYEREIDDLDQENTTIPDKAQLSEDLQTVATLYYPISNTDTFVPSIFPPPEQPTV